MKLFHLRTDNGQLFKRLIESLKEIMIETNMEISQKRIKISRMNSKNSIYCFLELEGDKINNGDNFFKCEYPEEKPLAVGINLLHLTKILKCIGSDNILHFQIEKTNKNALILKSENMKRLEISKYTVNFIETNEEKITIPNVEFDVILSLNAKYFQKIIKDMSNLDAKFIEIKFCNKQLFISGMGGYVFRETIIEESDDKNNILNIQKMKDDSNSYILQGKYDIKDLLSIVKFGNLSKNITIKIKNDIPLVISTDIENIGNLVLLIAVKNLS